MGEVNIAGSADVDRSASMGDGCRVWHLAQIREKAVLGRNCVIGRGAYVGAGVEIGDNVKVQNYALIYEPAIVASGALVGPGAVLTNDRYPRAESPDGQPKGPADWVPVGVTVREGASLGARSVCVAPITIGRWAMLGAGAVATKDVPDFALMVGSPARRVGWVGRAGYRLEQDVDGTWRCPSTDEIFFEDGDILREGRR